MNPLGLAKYHRELVRWCRSAAIAITAVIAVAILAVGCSSDEARDSEVELVLKTMTAGALTAPEPVIWVGGQLFDPSSASNYRNDEAGRFWKRFRVAYPFGLQGIAVSKVRGDGSCSVVVAEPPPHVTFGDVKKIVSHASIQTMPVGHDGALYDIVGTLQGGNTEIEHKLRLLNLLLFRTDYKAYAYREPFRTGWRDSARYNLEVQPTGAELHSWLYAKDSRFFPVTGGNSMTISQLLAERVSGVYRLHEKGLVVWWIPYGVTVSDCVAEIRMFALESDLIVGAVKDGGIMVLARQRIAPYDALPPIRAETVALLASVKAKGELSQSYQRFHPGAGLYSADFDWAPILLSRELVDTEFGHLLNVADQLLKGWSQHGEVRYERFPYQPPTNWPFRTALSKIVLKQFGKERLTFNWNTTGAGYVVAIGQTQVYVPFRTGALPVSYIPGEDENLAPEIAPYEDKAYDWYANLRNPTLAKVVQYAAIYQAFNNLDSNVAREVAPASNAPTQGLEAAMADLWRSVDATDHSSLEELAKNLAITRRLQIFVMQLSPEKRPMVDIAKLEAIFFEGLRRSFAVWTRLTPLQRNQIRKASFRLDGVVRDNYARQKLLEAQFFLSAIAAREQIADKYAAAVPPTGVSWIHTPVVVMSNPGRSNPLACGGHNVRAAATKLALDQEVSAGTVRITGKSVRLNGADIDRAPSLVREAARGLKSGVPPRVLEARLSTLLERTPPRPLRIPNQALKFTRGVPPPDYCPPSPGVVLLAAEGIKVPAEVMTMIGDVSYSPHRIAIVRYGEHFWVSGPDGLPPVLTSNLADASELASLRARASGGRPGGARRPVEFQLSNLTDTDCNVVLNDLRANARRRGYSTDVVAVVGKGRPGFRSLRLSGYDFRNPKVRVEAPQIVNGQRVSKVTVELTAKRPGLRNAFIEFWIRVKGAISDTQLASIARAIKIRVEQLFGRVAAGEIKGEDPLVLLQQEMNRISQNYNVEIETRVRDASKDWRLAVTGGVAAYV
jgi:hypothetical protein